MSWHADGSLIARYADGTLDRANSFSVEEHLLSCEQCRATATHAVERDRLDRIFTEVRDTVERPRLPFVAQVLVRLGMRDHLARLIASTPALTSSWLIAIAIATGWAVIAAHLGAGGSIPAFLVLAPLIPLAGVAASYGPAVDPTFEISLAAPMAGFRLFLLRAGTVLITTIGLVAAGSLALPGEGWTAVAWLLPALALTFTSVALSTWISAVWAAGTSGLLWISALGLSRAAGRGWSVRQLEVFTAAGQVSAAIVMVLALAIIAARVRTFDMGSQV